MRIDQLTPDNVGKLQKIWHYRTGRGGAFKATPIQVGDLLYACTGGNVIVALDAETGERRWEFDPQVTVPKIGNFGTTCRGVSYYRAPETYSGDCVERIVTATTDARMFAVDAKTGARCAAFGRNGEVNLLPGMGDVKPGFYFVTSPPTIARGRAIIGGWVMDNRKSSEPSGVVRAFDAMTGKFVWAWDMGRPGVNTEPAEGECYTRGTPNVWSLTSYDDKLGLVYVPTGNATPDYYGAHRSEASEKYASSVVALDVDDRRRALVVPDRASRHLGLRRAVAARAVRAAAAGRHDGAGARAGNEARRVVPARSPHRHAARGSARAAGAARRGARRLDARRRNRSRSACRSSAVPISPKRTCGA